jgi:poly(A) polymerase
LIYRRLMSRFKRKKADANASKAKHWDKPIPEQHISSNALKVLSGLHEAGFVAYLVGGGVRDLLVDKIPKDFDVSTDASPEQIRRIFRNSRIIGRRFRIVHVFYRHEIIEVTTFRAQINEPVTATAQEFRVANNTFGTVEEDAWRRDFTVNALYYNGKKRQVIDYTGGMEDLEKKLIRIIGDPAQRFHEDPVRLLRAIRLAAKLQFTIHQDTEAQISLLPELLQHVAESRLFDEVLKLFFTGHAYHTYQKLSHYGYFNALFPQTFAAMQSGDISAENIRAFVELAMHETDRRYREQNSLNPGFLFAVLLWPPVQQKLKENSRQKFHAALRCAIDEVLQNQAEVLVIPNRLSAMMRAIWLLQYSLTRPRGQRVYRTLFHRYFRAAFDFLELRVKTGDPEHDKLEWWRKFREANAETRQQMLEQLPKAKK